MKNDKNALISAYHVKWITNVVVLNILGREIIYSLFLFNYGIELACNEIEVISGMSVTCYLRPHTLKNTSQERSVLPKVR